MAVALSSTQTVNMKRIALYLVGALTVFSANACASSAQSYKPNIETAARIPAEQLPRVPACTGLPDEVRQTSLFAQRELVASVEPLSGTLSFGKVTMPKPRGARVILRALPGVTEQWLERIAACHLQTYEASKFSAADEPLSVVSAQAEVRSVSGGFAIDVTSESRDGALEIQERASRLTL
jgi:hypothetical protein